MKLSRIIPTDSLRSDIGCRHEISISTGNWNKTLFSAYIIRDRDHEKTFHLKTSQTKKSYKILIIPLKKNKMSGKGHTKKFI